MTNPERTPAYRIPGQAPARSPGDETDPGSRQSGEAICPRCNGSGRLESRSCPDCSGSGHVTVTVGDA